MRTWMRAARALPLTLTLAVVTAGCTLSVTSTPSRPVSTAPAVSTAVVTVTEHSTTTQTVTAPASSALEATPSPATSPAPAGQQAPAGSAGPAAPFVMPAEIGKDLQAAQDDVQRVSGNPTLYSDSRDATGAGRMQILDRNWIVCDQQPKAGAPVNADATITFIVVKRTEKCPN